MNPGPSCRVQSPGYFRLSPTGCLYVFQVPAGAFGADCADANAARATITDRAVRTCLPICRPVNVERAFIEVPRVDESRRTVSHGLHGLRGRDRCSPCHPWLISHSDVLMCKRKKGQRAISAVCPWGARG